MDPVRPVRLLVKVPVPVPSVVFVAKAVVGPVVVPQQTPLAVTAFPESDVTLPPLVAVVAAIDVASVVAATVGGVIMGQVPHVILAFDGLTNCISPGYKICILVYKFGFEVEVNETFSVLFELEKTE